MSKQPTTWDEALIAAKLVDPRNGNPSLNQLAIAANIPASTVTAIASGRRNPKQSTLQRIADALGIDVRIVSAWVGQSRTERAPYAPPAEADLLNDRQRRAVDEIIRAIVAERASERDERNRMEHGAVSDRPVRDGATTWWQDFDLAADEGERRLDEKDAAARRAGEESQDPGTDEPA